ncbi:membrane-associated protein, putative, partial [Bodo saltans]
MKSRHTTAHAPVNSWRNAICAMLFAILVAPPLTSHQQQHRASSTFVILHKTTDPIACALDLSSSCSDFNNATVCSLASDCQWCATSGVCRATNETCYSSCVDSTVETEKLCNRSTECSWCSSIGVCLPQNVTCYGTCPAATNDTVACNISASCQYCSVVGACRLKNETCYASCPEAGHALGAAFCSSTTQCRYCSNST